MLAGSLWPGHAAAMMWEVDQARSVVSFTFVEGGVAKSGRFEEFQAAIEYDPATPEATRALVRIATPSLNLQDVLRETVMRSASWLDTGAVPLARFQLTGLEPLGDDTLRATGIVAIKRMVRPVAFIARLSDIDGASVVASGALSIAREDFEIGDPALEAFVEIGEDIEITFKLVASPAAL